jgi:hypothetical protein
MAQIRELSDFGPVVSLRGARILGPKEEGRPREGAGLVRQCCRWSHFAAVAIHIRMRV